MAGRPTACEVCRRPTGPSCGLVLVNGNTPGPCVRCRVVTSVYSMCGVPRHYDCAGARVVRAATADQPGLRQQLATAGHDGTTINAAVRYWNATMREIEYTGPHSTALRILGGMFSWSSVPTPPPWQPEWLTPLEGAPMWQARSWLVPDAVRGHADGLDLVAYDINGMYLSAAGCELGTGAPQHLSWPPDDVLDLPGYVRTSTLETAPYGLLSRWEEGMWMPTPLARWLYEDGHQFLIIEALVWPEHRRWLGPHVTLFRDARATLLEAAAGHPAARVVLAVLKEVYTRMLGLVGSTKYNQGPGLNVHWHDMIPATGQARMFRGLDRVRHQETHFTSPVVVVGIHADAAWYLVPTDWLDPIGLEISTQLGKWKIGRRDDGTPQRVPWTPELFNAYQAEDHAHLRRALAGKLVEATV